MTTEAFPLVRITLYGTGSSGKTTLIDAFVNNGATPHLEPTDWPTLYYRVCRVREDEDARASDSALRTVCVELEDTYDAGRADDGRDIRKYMSMRRRIMEVQKGIKDFRPFHVWKPPRAPTGPRESLFPLTSGRMGMMLVFDVNQKATLAKTMELLDLLESVHEYKHENLKPVIFLVGNKYGKAFASFGSCVAGKDVSVACSQSKFIRFWKVSALDGKNVRKMFEEMIYRILGAPTLWELDYEEASPEEEEEEGCSLM